MSERTNSSLILLFFFFFSSFKRLEEVLAHDDDDDDNVSRSNVQHRLTSARSRATSDLFSTRLTTRPIGSNPPPMSIPTATQLADENRYLNDELNRVETILNSTRAEKDELSIRYNALSDRVSFFFFFFVAVLFDQLTEKRFRQSTTFIVSFDDYLNRIRFLFFILILFKYLA